MPVSPEIWLAFAAAAALLIAIPGPTTLMVMGHTMARGTRIGLLSLIGVTVCDICAITLSVLGFSALLAASATAFQIGRAHVCTPVTNAHLVCRLLLEKQ